MSSIQIHRCDAAGCDARQEWPIEDWLVLHRHPDMFAIELCPKHAAPIVRLIGEEVLAAGVWKR